MFLTSNHICPNKHHNIFVVILDYFIMNYYQFYIYGDFSKIYLMDFRNWDIKLDVDNTAFSI